MKKGSEGRKPLLSEPTIIVGNPMRQGTAAHTVIPVSTGNRQRGWMESARYTETGGMRLTDTTGSQTAISLK